MARARQVAVAVLPAAQLRVHMGAMVAGLITWSADSRNRFRLKVRGMGGGGREGGMEAGGGAGGEAGGNRFGLKVSSARVGRRTARRLRAQAQRAWMGVG
jgi:hypothetical protein